jgi:hypothetical protein
MLNLTKYGKGGKRELQQRKNKQELRKTKYFMLESKREKPSLR